MQAMEDSLITLKSRRIMSPGRLKRLDDIKSLLGYDDYVNRTDKYKVVDKQETQQQEQKSDIKTEEQYKSANFNMKTNVNNNMNEPDVEPEVKKEEIDIEILPPIIVGNSTEQNKNSGSPEWEGVGGSLAQFMPSSFTGPQICVIIRNIKTNKVELEFKLPLQWITRSSKLIPKVGGLDLENLVAEAVNDYSDLGNNTEDEETVLLLDVEESGYRVRIELQK